VVSSLQGATCDPRYRRRGGGRHARSRRRLEDRLPRARLLPWRSRGPWRDRRTWHVQPHRRPRGWQGRFLAPDGRAVRP